MTLGRLVILTRGEDLVILTYVQPDDVVMQVFRGSGSLMLRDQVDFAMSVLAAMGYQTTLDLPAAALPA